MIDYDKFTKALKQLELQQNNYKTANARPELTELDLQGIGESVIQRFETTYDCLWKSLKRFLLEDLGIPDIPNSPKPLLRMAHENKLFTSSIEQWLAYADARIATSHDYDHAKAKACLLIMDAFIADAIDLHQTMTKRPWE